MIERNEQLEFELATTFWTKRPIYLQLYAVARPITKVCSACHLEFDVPSIYAGTRAFSYCNDPDCIEARLKGCNLADRKGIQ
jgi:hypothetical protein